MSEQPPKKLGHAGSQCVSGRSRVACRQFPRTLSSRRTSLGRLWLGSGRSTVPRLNVGDQAVVGGLALSCFGLD